MRRGSAIRWRLSPWQPEHEPVPHRKTESQVGNVGADQPREDFVPVPPRYEEMKEQRVQSESDGLDREKQRPLSQYLLRLVLEGEILVADEHDGDARQQPRHVGDLLGKSETTDQQSGRAQVAGGGGQAHAAALEQHNQASPPAWLGIDDVC